jgi:transposase InsO family protein
LYLQCDNAAKYIGDLKEKLAKVGTTLAPVSPYHPQQNGEAERFNRTVGDMAHTMLHAAKLPKIYWSFAYKTAAYINNRILKKSVATSPLEALYKTQASPNPLYPFGARAIVTLLKATKMSLMSKGSTAS